MPYYDFRCKACEGSFELQLPVERRDDAACPSCGSREVKRTMPLVYAVVKGAPTPAGADVECCGAEGGGCCGGACACSGAGAGAHRAHGW